MSRIRLLSEQTANQIAAGEVVDRPAAVVKELMENSLDAGASRIEVEVEGGGVSLIRVSDDGEGMDKDDVLLCLERHATSKLREAAELQDIRSLGFRGEAIPSIASVSWLTILSRRRDQSLGARAEVRHGVLREVREEGCATGTVMEVRQLFANMPARKKFLKSQRTELFHMEECVKNLALAHPLVAFRYRVDGRSVLDCPPEEGLAERLRRIFRYQDALISLNAGEESAGAEGTEDAAAHGMREGMRVEGYLLLPEKTPASTARLRLFVNQRAVQDNMLRYAVRDALQGHLMRGYQPAGMLQVMLSPAEVDVNVHPAKREIRFRNGEAVRRLVAATVTAALKRQEQNLRASIFTQAGAEQGRAGQGQSARTQPQLDKRQPVQRPLQSPLSSAEPPPVPSFFAGGQDAALAALHIQEAGAVAEAAGAAGAGTWGDSAVSATVQSEPIEQIAAGEGSETGAEQFAGLRLIGQFFSLYLLCERQGHLVVIDQHAAHERILYGRMVQNYLSGQAPGQNLLFPETIELEPSLHEILEDRQAEVEAMGFGLSFFGDSTWVIQQVPALASGLAAEAALREVLQTLRSVPLAKDAPAVPGGHLTPAMEQVFAGLACKAAIKAGNRLEPREMLDLLAQMEASAVFSRCPHGRPVLKIFTAAEVEQWFHRHGG